MCEGGIYIVTPCEFISGGKPITIVELTANALMSESPKSVEKAGAGADTANPLFLLLRRIGACNLAWGAARSCRGLPGLGSKWRAGVE